MLGYAPPTSRSVEALIMLGTLGSYAFDIMDQALDDALEGPLGFLIAGGPLNFPLFPSDKRARQGKIGDS